ncbi:M14 family metallopeptidase [Parapusillimonas sp. JC17]|uniref:M14 family metallopeptidase n=1 Tax=Parapusillimonas sp. JC17 TaxID=3445768 RepID=UPI003F9F4863
MISELLKKMRPGTIAHERLRVGTMSSGMVISIPVTIVKGRSDGACLWVNGQVHGNELNGVVAAVELGRRLKPESMSGSVVITPTANPLGLDNHTKTAPQDLQDLDQAFPGNAGGLTTNQMAHALFSEVKSVASCLVNLHTMGSIHDSKPYCVYKVYGGGAVAEEKLLRMTSYFEPSVSCRMDIGGAGELPGNIAGALDYQCLLVGIPAFMVELGQGSWYTPENVELAVSGLMKLAQELGILEGTPQAGSEVRRVTARQWVILKEGGLFLSTRKPGETIPANQAIGQVLDMHGRTVCDVTLPKDCIIIGIRRDPVVHSGDRVAFVATHWDSAALQK